MPGVLSCAYILLKKCCANFFRLCCKNKDKIILVNKNHITRSTEMDKIVTLYVDVVMPFSLHVKQVCSGVADSEQFFCGSGYKFKK